MIAVCPRCGWVDIVEVTWHGPDFYCKCKRCSFFSTRTTWKNSVYIGSKPIEGPKLGWIKDIH